MKLKRIGHLKVKKGVNLTTDLNVFFTGVINDLKRLNAHRVQLLSKTTEEVGIALIFEKWVTENIVSFRGHEPIRISRRKRVTRYCFKGITKKLYLHIGEVDGQFMLVVTHKGRCWDIIQAWDVSPLETKNGFHCSLCLGRKLAYKSREQLLIAHSLKPLAAWARRNFRRGKYLVLAKAGGCSSAAISDEAPKEAESVPVVIGRNR